MAHYFLRIFSRSSSPKVNEQNLKLGLPLALEGMSDKYVF